ASNRSNTKKIFIDLVILLCYADECSPIPFRIPPHRPASPNPFLSYSCKLSLPQPFCFDTHTNCPGGSMDVSSQKLSCSPRSFALLPKTVNSSPLFSFASALFRKTPGCTPEHIPGIFPSLLILTSLLPCLLASLSPSLTLSGRNEMIIRFANR